MGQETAYAHFCHVKRHSIKSNISRCAQLARRSRPAGTGRSTRKAGREHHLLAARSVHAASCRTHGCVGPAGGFLWGRTRGLASHQHRPRRGEGAARRLWGPASSLLPAWPPWPPSAARGPPQAVPAPDPWRLLSQGSLDVGRYRHQMVFRDHPQNQKEAEPEPHPDAQQARGPALHPDSALRRQWACRDTPLRPRDADKLPESSAPVQDGSGAQQPARPQRAVTPLRLPASAPRTGQLPSQRRNPPRAVATGLGLHPRPPRAAEAPVREAARAPLGEGLRKARSRGLLDPRGPSPGEGPLETRLLAVARKRIPPAPPQNAFSLRIKTAANFKFNNRGINA